MRDFTAIAYNKLLDTLRNQGYKFQTFQDFLRDPQEHTVILRHDVDKMPRNSELFAYLEHKTGIRASYYFRTVPQSFQRQIIRRIASLGHEIGYHYEDLDLCNGDLDKAYLSFQKNLAMLRELVPVQTICMHGSPMSRQNNRELWSTHDYRRLGIMGETYSDIDYSKVLYLTDTGRGWNFADASIRDKVTTSFDIKARNTWHLIRLIQEGGLASQIMINTHPQRWNDNVLLWLRELLWQNIKNIAKKAITSKHKG
jgi:hypothetical protein